MLTGPASLTHFLTLCHRLEWQHSNTDHMYLLVSGRCRVLKRMDLSDTLQAKLSTARGQGAGLRFDEKRPSRGAPSMQSLGDAAPVLELGELTVHQYFGERALLDGKHKGVHTASVVSITPVEVLLLSKYDFYHCIDSKTQNLMAVYADKFYYDEERIRRSISNQSRWDAYKTGLLKDLLRVRD